MEAVRIALLETRREVSALRLLCQVPSNMNFSHSHRRLLCSIACLADFSRRNKYMIPYSRSCGKGLVRQKERLRLRDKKCVHFRTKMRALLDESARTFSRVSAGSMPSSCASSAQRHIVVSGVLNSCETLERKSVLRIASSRALRSLFTSSHAPETSERNSSPITQPPIQSMRSYSTVPPVASSRNTRGNGWRRSRMSADARTPPSGLAHRTHLHRRRLRVAPCSVAGLKLDKADPGSTCRRMPDLARRQRRRTPRHRLLLSTSSCSCFLSLVRSLKRKHGAYYRISRCGICHQIATGRCFPQCTYFPTQKREKSEVRRSSE